MTIKSESGPIATKEIKELTSLSKTLENIYMPWVKAIQEILQPADLLYLYHLFVSEI